MKQNRRRISLLCAVLFMAVLLPVFSLPVSAASCRCGGSFSKRVAYSPTCTEDGMAVYTCTSCGYTYEASIPALGHNYKVSTTATCTSDGIITYTCTRCGDSYQDESAALGHSYAETITEPTCTEDGERVLECWRCGKRYVTALPATGHDYEEEVTEPTCTEDGVKKSVCKNCGEELTEVIPATGHDYEITETAPTCTEDGKRSGICTVCGDTFEEVLPAAGHSYGEWTVTVKPTLFKEGQEEHICSECSAVETGSLPKKTLTESPGALAAIAAAVLAAGAGIALLVKKALVSSAAKAAGDAASLGYITLQMKKLIVSLQENETNKAFLDKLKERPYLDIKTVPFGDSAALTDLAAKEHPDLILLSADSVTALSALTGEITAAYKDADFSVIDETGLNAAALSAMKESGAIMAFASASDNGELKLAKLILPLYKPDRSTGNWAENATLITDAIGLPIISILLNTYVVGGDVVDAVKNRGMGTADTADLVNDVAGLFGLDVLANIAEVLRVGADQKDRVDDKKELDNQ